MESLNNSDNKELQPNMLCITKLNDLSMDSVLVVPVNIVQNDGNGNYLYVGANGLRVIDVSDPTKPHEVGHYVTGDHVNNVTIHNNHIYEQELYRAFLQNVRGDACKNVAADQVLLSV